LIFACLGARVCGGSSIEQGWVSAATAAATPAAAASAHGAAAAGGRVLASKLCVWGGRLWGMREGDEHGLGRVGATKRSEQPGRLTNTATNTPSHRTQHNHRRDIRTRRPCKRASAGLYSTQLTGQAQPASLLSLVDLLLFSVSTIIPSSTSSSSLPSRAVTLVCSRSI